MNYYYDPILGLQYTSGYGLIEINLDSIPVEYSIKDIMELYAIKGVMLAKSIPSLDLRANQIINSNVYEASFR